MLPQAARRPVRAPHRPLSDHGPHRQRRHGHGLPRARPRPRARGRDQDARGRGQLRLRRAAAASRWRRGRRRGCRTRTSSRSTSSARTAGSFSSRWRCCPAPTSSRCCARARRCRWPSSSTSSRRSAAGSPSPTSAASSTATSSRATCGCSTTAPRRSWTSGSRSCGADHHITKTGMMVGTVHYMSPEQVRGRPLDGRTDVFSAGVILYELLAGERPFTGEDVTAILYKIVNEEPKRRSSSPAFGELAPQLRAVLDKALAKDAAARYAGAAAFAEELGALSASVQRSRAGSAGDPGRGAHRCTPRAAARDTSRRRSRGCAAWWPSTPTGSTPRRALRVALREEKRRKEPSPGGRRRLSRARRDVPGRAHEARRGRHRQPSDPVSGSPALAPTVCRAVGSARGSRAAHPFRRGPGSSWGRRLPGRRDRGGGRAAASFGDEAARRSRRRLRLPRPHPARPAPSRRSRRRWPRRSLPRAHASRREPRSRSTARAVAGVTPLELALDPGDRAQASALALDGYTAAGGPRRGRGAARGARGDAREAASAGSGRGPVGVRRSTWSGAGARSPGARLAARPATERTPGADAAGGAVFLKADVTVEVPVGGEVALERPDARQAERARHPRATARCSWTTCSSTTRRSATGRSPRAATRSPSSGPTARRSAAGDRGQGEQALVRRGPQGMKPGSLVVVLLALARPARRAGDARPAGAPPARGRPRVPGAGQVRSRRSTTSTSSSRASRTPTRWARRCSRSAATAWRSRATPPRRGPPSSR